MSFVLGEQKFVLKRMCTFVAGCFFLILFFDFLGQKDAEMFFCLISNFGCSLFCCWSGNCSYEIQWGSSTVVEGHQQSFLSAPNVDGILERAGANYKWPVELGKCSKGSLGHPEAPTIFFLSFFCWKNCFIIVQPKNPKHKRLKECKHW